MQDEETSDDPDAVQSSTNSSEEDIDINETHQPEVQQLRQWATKNKIYLSHLDELLAILRVRLIPDLPKSAKAFLRTTKAQYNIIPMPDSKGSMGEFVYFGVAKGLIECVNDDLHPNNLIELQINVDGVPLVKSGYQEFWPILCKVHCDADLYEPYPVAVYFGESKPASLDSYLNLFIEEINNLQRDGIEISGKHFAVTIKCFICDTPARSFLKCTIGHLGINACERCTVEGVRVENRTVYPDTNSEERTDASFRGSHQPSHHTGISPLLRILPFLNMIHIFVLDFMHLCCQGIMKKLLEYWIVAGVNKFNVAQRHELSRRMELLKKQIPYEFQRKPRSTNCIGKWKATELRFFLLYCGPVVLKDVLLSKLYKHFLLLHVSCRILCSEKYCKKYRIAAKQYLVTFFQYLGEYYGPSSQTVNSHHLIHLADDVLFINSSLSKVTAFPFESLLGKLKRLLRTPHRPLAQLCRRLHEQKITKNEKPTVPRLVEILQKNDEDIVKIMYKRFTITNMSPNNVLLLKDKTIFEVLKISMNDDNIDISGKVWKKKKSIFIFPFDSGRLNMWQLHNRPVDNIVTFPLSSVDCKMVHLSVNLREQASDKVFVIPLLHH